MKTTTRKSPSPRPSITVETRFAQPGPGVPTMAEAVAGVALEILADGDARRAAHLEAPQKRAAA